ncbi:MAG TPA: hypothetical protein V6C65_00395 [Allocoleopsis sp.]
MSQLNVSPEKFAEICESKGLQVKPEYSDTEASKLKATARPTPKTEKDDRQTHPVVNANNGSNGSDRIIPINDASTGMSVALRETAVRHKQQLDRFRSTKQAIARQVAQAYAEEIKSFDADVAAALVGELGGVEQSSNPFSFDLTDIWEEPSNPLIGYQPKYLDCATAD